MNTIQILAIIIFLVTLVAIMSEKIHRSVAALTGAVLLLLLSIESFDQCIEAIDFNTIGVLIGMMLFVAVVRNSGIFEYIAIKTAKFSKGNPWIIMLTFMIITALLSAFLDNVTTVLLVGPMTIAVTEILGIDPIPFLISQIVSSNIGGTMTLIGDPPNIMIGSKADLSFLDFLLNNSIPVFFVLVATMVVFYIMYGKNLKVSPEKMNKITQLDEKKAIKSKSLTYKSIVVMILVVIAFSIHSQFGVESSVVALAAASIMMIIGKQDAEEIILNVEWSTILFFVGLFIAVGGLEATGVIDLLAGGLLNLTNGHPTLTMLVILWISAIVSSFLDNIPFVATMIPLILALEAGGMNVTSLWWALSLGACFGGNGTLIGASANVVLAGIGKKNGYPITFKAYFKKGFPLMILSMIISTVVLLIKF